MKRFMGVLLAGALLAGAHPVAAQGPDWLRVGVVGGWGYGHFDQEDGGYGDDASAERASAGLNLSSVPLRWLHLSAQAEAHRVPGETEVELDFALAEVRVVDQLRVRLGRVKQPFGLFTEIFDVGVARPFLSLPQGLYWGGMVGEGYTGAGVTGAVQAGAWDVEYDAYAGQLETKGFLLPEPEAGIEDEEEEEGVELGEVVGGRVTFQTPVPGLRFGGSAYSGAPEADADAEDAESPGRTRVAGVHAEHAAYGWAVRSEVALFDSETLQGHTFYVEGVRRVWSDVQLAVRFERYRGEGDDEELGAVELDHTDIAAGVNYWFRPTVVTRAAYHWVDGARFLEDADGDGRGFFEVGIQVAY